MAAGTEDISHVESADYLREHEAALVGAYVLPELSSHDEVANNSIRNVFRVTKGITLANSFLMCYLYFAGTMAYIVPPTQVSFMVADLGRPDLAAWVSTATSVGICAVLPVSGALTDVVGRRWAMIAGSLLGVAGSIVAGRADSTKMIIAGQALSGAAIALCFVSPAALAEIIPAFARPFWATAQHFLGTIGQVVGPIYAGAFVKASVSGWRWPFYINAIIFGLGAVGTIFIYHPKSRVRALGFSKRGVIRQIDFVGLFLFLAGVTCLLLGLSWGGNVRYGWKNAHAIAPTVIGVVIVLIVLPVYEIFGCQNAVFDRQLFRDRTFIMLNIISFVEGFALLTSSVYFPQILLKFWTKDPVTVGVYRIPFAISGLISQTGSGLIFQKTGRYKKMYIGLATLLLIGPALFGVLTAHQSVGVPLGISVLTGLAVGGIVQVSLITAQYCVPQTKLGISLGIINTVRVLGGAIGVAIFNSILSTRQNSYIPRAVTAAATKAGARASELPLIVKAAVSGNSTLLVSATDNSTAVIGAVKLAVLNTTSASYRIIFLSSIPFGAISLAACFLLREVNHYMSDEVVFGLAAQEKAAPAGLRKEQETVEKNL